MEILEHLAVKIGNRVAGKPEAFRAGDYLAGKFSELGLEVELQEFKFVSWELDSPPTLNIRSPVKEEIAVGPMPYTESTPEEGVTGYLKRIGTAYIVPGLFEWPKYAVIGKDGRELAYLLGHLDGKAIPMPNAQPMFMSPQGIISEADHLRIEGWLAEGEVEVSFRSLGHYAPGYVGRNVIATLPGKSEETVVVCAHYDSALGTSGAVDNASGVQALYDTACRIIEAKPERTFRFIAFDAEEWDLLGSKFYVSEAKTRGKLGEIKACINIDTVGIGNTLFCWVGPDFFHGQVDQILHRLGVKDKFKVDYSKPLSGSDHYPFWLEEIPVVMILFWPYEAYHLPADSIDIVDANVTRTATDIAYEIATILKRAGTR
ncbi:MAG: M28 family peptidase [Anaerolineae bacterium]